MMIMPQHATMQNAKAQTSERSTYPLFSQNRTELSDKITAQASELTPIESNAHTSCKMTCVDNPRAEPEFWVNGQIHSSQE